MRCLTLLVASVATINLSMSWQFSYITWLVQIAITNDEGASVQVYSNTATRLTFALIAVNYR